MQKLFFLAEQGQPSGPFSADSVLNKLQSRDYMWTDYIWDEHKKDWLMVMDHPEFAKHFKATSGPSKPGQSVSKDTMVNDFNTQIADAKLPENSSAWKEMKEKAWYTLKDGNNYGPYSYVEMIHMLQNKTLFEYDYVWNAQLSAWKRVSEVEQFSAESIRKIKNAGFPDIQEVFFRRRHVRAHYGCSVIVHNNKTVFRAKSVEISAGGAGLYIETDQLHPGQTVFLHFQPGNGVPPFNAVCEVVSKIRGPSKSRDLNLQNTVKYGIRFTSISQNVRETIKSFTVKAA